MHKGDVGRVYRGFANQYGILNIGYDISFNENLHIQSHVGVRSYERTQQESSFGEIDTLKSNTGVNQLIVPADISLAWLQGKSGSLSIGADYQSARYYTWTDALVGYRTFGNKSSAVQGGVYIQEEWRPVAKFTLRGGLRYAYIKNEIDLVNGGNATDKSLSWNKLLWSIGTRYTINDWAGVFANGGSSFSTPGLKAIGGTLSINDFGVPGRNGQLPNPGLKPENGIGMDAGFDCKLPAHLKMGIRCFYTILQDGIIDNVVSRNPSQTQSINTESTSKGGEIEVSQHINRSVYWYMNATYMVSNIKNKLNNDLNNAEFHFHLTSSLILEEVIMLLLD